MLCRTYTNCSKNILKCSLNYVIQCFKPSIHCFKILLNVKMSENFKSSTNGLSEQSEQLTKDEKIQQIVTEYETWKSVGKKVPPELKSKYVEELLTLPTKSERRNQLAFFRNEEFKKVARLAKKDRRKAERERRKAEEISFNQETSDSESDIHLGAKNLLLKIGRKRLQKMYVSRLIQAMLFGQKLVVDLSYDEFMRKHECKNCAYQLQILRKENMKHQYPYNLYFCNVSDESWTANYLKRDKLNLDEDPCASYTGSSYLDIFPKESLVYLSPHAEESLKEYDHNAIYIIGGFVDKSHVGNISFKKAQREGIKSYRLPLDEHVKWKCGSKSLTIDQVIQIMLEMKTTGDWKKSLRFLPSRKIVSNDQS